MKKNDMLILTFFIIKKMICCHKFYFVVKSDMHKFDFI